MEPTSPSPVMSADRTFGRAPKKGNRAVIILIILAIIIVGIFIALRGSNSEEKKEEEITPTVEVIEEPTAEPTEAEESPTPTKKPTPTVKPTPSEVTSAYDMRIQVQNGSGEVGVAGQAAAHLKSKGYENVETDNADNYDYTGVTVRIKSTRSKYLSTLLSDLKEKYDSAAEGDALPASSDFDAIVIVGK